MNPSPSDAPDSATDPNSLPSRLARLDVLWVSLRSCQAYYELSDGGYALDNTMLSAADRVEEAFFAEWEQFVDDFELSKLAGYDKGADWLYELVDETDLSGVSTGHWEPFEPVLRRLGLHPAQ